MATIKLSDAVKQALERYLARSGENHEQVLEHALRHYLRAHGEVIAGDGEAKAKHKQRGWLMLLEQIMRSQQTNGRTPC